MASITGLIMRPVNYIKSYWRVPKEGEHVSLKELSYYGMGGMGIYLAGDVFAMLMFTGTASVTGMIYGIEIRHAYIIGIIGTIIGYLLTPLGIMITDNLGNLSKKTMRTIHVVSAIAALASVGLWFMQSTRFDTILRDLYKHIAIKIVCTIISNYLGIYVLKFFGKKYGKYKPHMVLFGIPTLILATIYVFMPYQELTYSTKLIRTHIITNLIFMFNGPYTGNVGTIQGLMTPNSQERTKIFSFMPMLLGLFRSIFGIIFPIIASFTGGVLDITSYRYVVPIIGAIGIIEGFFIIKAKERVVVPKDHKVKVNILESAKVVFSNKYLWIKNISDLFGGFANMCDGVLNWIVLYGTRMQWVYGLLLNITYLPGNIGNMITPLVTRRYSKRTSILFMKSIQFVLRFGLIGVILIPSDVGKIVIVMAVSMISGIFNATASVIQNTLMPDVWDFLQWKTGKRLEASTGLFGYLTTPLGQLLGFISPYILKVCGLVSDWDIMYDPVIRNRLITIHIVITFAGMIISYLPYSFWDLTPEKMKKIASDLQKRADATAENTNEATAKTLTEGGEVNA